MPWLLASPSHQQQWYWLCRIGRSLSYMSEDFNHLCHVHVEQKHKVRIYIYIPSGKFSTQRVKSPMRRKVSHHIIRWRLTCSGPGLTIIWTSDELLSSSPKNYTVHDLIKFKSFSPGKCLWIIASIFLEREMHNLLWHWLFSEHKYVFAPFITFKKRLLCGGNKNIASWKTVTHSSYTLIWNFICFFLKVKGNLLFPFTFHQYFSIVLGWFYWGHLKTWCIYIEKSRPAICKLNNCWLMCITYEILTFMCLTFEAINLLCVYWNILQHDIYICEERQVAIDCKEKVAHTHFSWWSSTQSDSCRTRVTQTRHFWTD